MATCACAAKLQKHLRLEQGESVPFLSKQWLGKVSDAAGTTPAGSLVSQFRGSGFQLLVLLPVPADVHTGGSK